MALCNNVRRLMASHAGVMVGVIDVKAVEVDVVDTGSE
jgi:hypothetical protein